MGSKNAKMWPGNGEGSISHHGVVIKELGDGRRLIQFPEHSVWMAENKRDRSPRDNGPKFSTVWHKRVR